jgi:hypothetical protein
MTSGQKAIMALDIERYEAEEARKRQEATQFSAVVERIPPPSEPGKARDKAAAAVGVNPRYVSDAKKLERESPALLERVKTGELSLPAAKAQARDDAPAVPAGRFCAQALIRPAVGLILAPSFRKYFAQHLRPTLGNRKQRACCPGRTTTPLLPVL